MADRRRRAAKEGTNKARGREHQARDKERECNCPSYLWLPWASLEKSGQAEICQLCVAVAIEQNLHDKRRREARVKLSSSTIVCVHRS